MNRRKILTWVGLGWIVSVLPPALTSCSTATKQAGNSLTALANPLPASSPVSATNSSAIASSPAATTARKGSRVIGSITQLERDGQLIADGVIVVRDRNNPQKLFAVNPICTHKGCDVNWQKDKQEFFCPCHDATFAADGSPREAPAKIPLATYAVTVENEQVLISNGGEIGASSSLQNDQASTNVSPQKRDRASSAGQSEKTQNNRDRAESSSQKREHQSSESESEREDDESRKGIANKSLRS